METFSALLVICAGKSPVPGEFATQRPVTRSFDVFFDLDLSKRLSKQSWGWWLETPPSSLWRHCNEMPQHFITMRMFVPLQFTASSFNNIKGKGIYFVYLVISISTKLLWIFCTHRHLELCRWTCRYLQRHRLTTLSSLSSSSSWRHELV